MKKLSTLLIALCFASGSLIAQQQDSEPQTEPRTFSELMEALGRSMESVGESMQDLREVIAKHKDKFPEGSYVEHEDGSISINIEGDLSDYMSEKEAAAFEADMEAWGEEFGEEFGAKMEAWGENFGQAIEDHAEELGSYLESLFDDLEINIEVESSDEDEKKSSKKKKSKTTRI